MGNHIRHLLRTSQTYCGKPPTPDDMEEPYNLRSVNYVLWAKENSKCEKCRENFCITAAAYIRQNNV